MISMKKISWIVTLVFILSLTACGSQDKIPDIEVQDTTVKESNPFENNGTAVIGFIEHSVQNPNLDENGKIQPFVFDGDEMDIQYSMRVEGKAETVGFLIFVNGKAQGYKVNDSEEIEYCHFFTIEQDNGSEKQLFDFKFMPVDGNMGEDVDLAIVSIYNPNFMPDMVNTSSYGWYHGILDNHYVIHMDEDAPLVEETFTMDMVTDVSFNSKKVTEDFLKNNLTLMGWSDVNTEDLNEQTYYEITYDGKMAYDNIKLKNTGEFYITYSLCGSPGVEYVTTMYINHHPVSVNDDKIMKTTLSKGNISILDIDMDIAKLSDMNTLYFISVPKNADDYPNVNAMIIKTKSILLYK